MNPVYASDATDPVSLLDRYATLTGWARAVGDAGARMTVVQRFSQDASVVRDSVPYVFIRDDGPPFPPPEWTRRALATRIADLDPDVVHVNGLMFPALTATLRSLLPPTAAIVAQDHAGYEPPRDRRLFRRLARSRLWRDGFDALDACSFTDDAQAEPWRAAGWLHETRVLAIVESSTTLRAEPSDSARMATGTHGAPAIVWIGRLDSNKDPLTVLDGLDLAFERLADARAWMIYQSATLERAVRERITRSPRLTDRVTLVGQVPHDRIASYLSAADLFISGSHREGSGYALIEAMACGAVPVISDIPSFRAIAGDCGARWAPGDATACATAILHAAALDRDGARDRVMRHFARDLSWRAIGARTMALYSDLSARRHADVSG